MNTGKITQTDPDRRFRRVLTASTLEGDRVKNSMGHDLGKVDEIMLDLPSGRIAYVVVSYGGVLGMGNKLFAIPWEAVKVDEDDKALILDVAKERLETAPGFDKDNWPDMADPTWAAGIQRYYGTEAAWEERERLYSGQRTFRGGGGV